MWTQLLLRATHHPRWAKSSNAAGSVVHSRIFSLLQNYLLSTYDNVEGNYEPVAAPWSSWSGGRAGSH